MNDLWVIVYFSIRPNDIAQRSNSLALQNLRSSSIYQLLTSGTNKINQSVFENHIYYWSEVKFQTLKSKTISMSMQRVFLVVSVIISCMMTSCDSQHVITNGDLQLVVSDQLHTEISSIKESKTISNLAPTEYLTTKKGMIADFAIQGHKAEKTPDGVIHHFTGLNTKNQLIKELTVTKPNSLSNLFLIEVHYINIGSRDVTIRSWTNHSYSLKSQYDPPFWAFQGSSSNERADWIKPIDQGYYQKNFMGMNNSDYGGGIPATDVWNPDYGLILGHAETQPKQISLPTEMKKYDDNLTVGIKEDFTYPYYLKAGDTLSTLKTFVALHEGDYYNGLQQYTTLMQQSGIKMPKSEPEAFEPIWCAWGYERNFTLNEVKNTLPKVKELGIKWAVLDDGYQQAEGDWNTNKTKFPEGDVQMRRLVEEIHSHGLKAKLWWAPLAADPQSNLLNKNPDMRLYLEDWAPQYITWWDAYYLSPSHPKTIDHTKQMVKLFIDEWDFDGLKLDGQHMNAIAPDHNPNAQLTTPDQGPEKLPQLFKAIYDEARTIKSNAVIENCPCGTCMSYFNMPYMNQAVSSDPLSSWQIRLKGKAYKALVPNTAYYGDHVELSDNGSDFASSFGIGAVLGTKFTWPKDNPSASASYLLTPEKETLWKRWFELYNQKMISKEKYLGNLYDIGYDKPEAHAIQKGDTLHYAFYVENWDDLISFKGLKPGDYIVNDYFNDQILGEINGSKPQLHVQFQDFILVEVYPKEL